METNSCMRVAVCRLVLLGERQRSGCAGALQRCGGSSDDFWGTNLNQGQPCLRVPWHGLEQRNHTEGLKITAS